VPVARLGEQWGVPRLVVCQRVGSTNDAARQLAEAGCPDGTCVLAEEQTAGRGREERTWSSPAGQGIWLSLVLRPARPAEPGALPLLVGLAVARALTPFCKPAVPRVKWPNDILLDDRKLGGILCEGAWERERLSFVVAGIGLNVLQLPADFPPELRDSATSVREAAGWSPSRAELAGAVVGEVRRVLESPVLDAVALAELERRDALRGRAVRVTAGGGQELSGEALGIGADGSLLVRATGDEVRRIRSGTVRLDGRTPGA
jgi:BirA family transcriptional regulator, biotin operon repressor / biotin---[acetyl-CoA-carboxylase] ligase